MKGIEDVYEVGIMMLLAFLSALMNAYLPLKDTTSHFGLPGPAAGIAFFGGFTFVFWIFLAIEIIGRRLAAVVTALFTASFCMFLSPLWFGITSPPWFGAYGVLSLLSIAFFAELSTIPLHSGKSTSSEACCVAGGFAERSKVCRSIFGGFGNLSCLVISWLIIGYHTSTWIPPLYAPIYSIFAFISGFVGALLAHIVSSSCSYFLSRNVP